jgi:MOSC domain-containing protein YiiM
MKIVSTNIAKPTTFRWRGKDVVTGIYKKPTQTPIYLGKEEVRGDEVSDRKVHGGVFKACYLFSQKHYAYWEKLYPQLDWHYGMLGENLTVSNLDETELIIGNIYTIGEVEIQITQPREPCFKFAAKFGSNAVLRQFIDYGCPGTYVKVLNEGFVKEGDIMVLKKTAENSISIADFFNLLYAKEKDQDLLKIVTNLNAIPEKKRIKLAAYIKSK